MRRKRVLGKGHRLGKGTEVFTVLTVCKEEQGCQVQRAHEEGKCGRVNEICESVAHPEQKLGPKFDPPTIFI